VPTILPLASSLSSCCWLFSFQTNPSAAREIYSIWLLFQDFHKNCGGLLLKEPGAPKRSTHPRWSQGTLMFGNAVGHHLMWRTGRFISFWCEGKEFKKKNELLSQQLFHFPNRPAISLGDIWLDKVPSTLGWLFEVPNFQVWGPVEVRFSGAETIFGVHLFHMGTSFRVGNP